MKLNVSYPATGCQKVFEVDDEQKLKHFYDKRMAQVHINHFILTTVKLTKPRKSPPITSDPNGLATSSVSLVATTSRVSQ